MRSIAFSLYRKSDLAAGRTAHIATTLGQMALVALGVHLAADSLDDRLYGALAAGERLLDSVALGPLTTAAEAVGLHGDTLVLWQGLPLAAAGAWAALAAELSATLLLWGAFVLSKRDQRPSLRTWRATLSVRAVVMPFALAGAVLAGAWSMAMAVEDLLPAQSQPGWLPAAAGALVGLAALARFGLPAWMRAVAALDFPERRTEGLLAAAVLLPVGLLAWADGVPIWAWLPLVGVGS